MCVVYLVSYYNLLIINLINTKPNTGRYQNPGVWNHDFVKLFPQLDYIL